MTYAELIRELMELPRERLLDDVTVYIKGVDEFYFVEEFQIAVGDICDVIDDGHAYLEI